MFWIHGGGFHTGSSRLNLYGPNYLMDKDIILVTINYRLGILGFLSTGDDVAPGNFGMKDQVLALKWVQNNIQAFGGDPKRVTIFGDSAGGASVTHHAMSDKSNGKIIHIVLKFKFFKSFFTESFKYNIISRMQAFFINTLHKVVIHWFLGDIETKMTLNLM